MPSAGPQGLQDRSISKEASVISWEAIPLAQCNGHITHYTLYLAAPTGSPQTYQPSKCRPVGHGALPTEPGCCGNRHHPSSMGLVGAELISQVGQQLELDLGVSELKESLPLPAAVVRLLSSR